jgi:hypothetical protein
MAHQITTSLCWDQPFGWWRYPVASPSATALFVTSVDQNGNLKVFQQSPGGVWSAFAAPAATVTFQSVLGVYNYIFALGSDNFLYVSVFSGGGWSAFAQIPQPQLYVSQLPQPIYDFSAVELIDSIMIVVSVHSVADQTLNIGLYSCCLDFTPDQPSNLSGAIDGIEWSIMIEATGLDPSLSEGAIIPALSVVYPSWKPTIPVVAIVPDSLAVDSWYNNNGTYNNPAAFQNIGQPDPVYTFSSLAIPTALVLTTGANQTFQAIMLFNRQPWLFYSIDGKNWTMFGSLLPGNVTNPPSFDKLATGFDSGGNLQVVALGNNGSNDLPYLFWQNQADSSWLLFQFDNQNGGPFGALNNPFTNPQNVYPIDLTTGFGWNGSSFALQVPYLGSDYNVYLSWQDDAGNWYPYSGLNGNGLP